RYIPTIISQSEIRKVINSMGYEVEETTDDLQDVEALARKKETDHQKRMLILGMVFTIPLFIFSMSRDLGLFVVMIKHASWANSLVFLLGGPVQFTVGRDFFVGAYIALRNEAANMVLLIAISSSAVFLYTIPALSE